MLTRSKSSKSSLKIYSENLASFLEFFAKIRLKSPRKQRSISKKTQQLNKEKAKSIEVTVRLLDFSKNDCKLHSLSRTEEQFVSPKTSKKSNDKESIEVETTAKKGTSNQDENSKTNKNESEEFPDFPEGSPKLTGKKRYNFPESPVKERKKHQNKLRKRRRLKFVWRSPEESKWSEDSHELFEIDDFYADYEIHAERKELQTFGIRRFEELTKVYQNMQYFVEFIDYLKKLCENDTLLGDSLVDKTNELIESLGRLEEVEDVVKLVSELEEVIKLREKNLLENLEQISLLENILS